MILLVKTLLEEKCIPSLSVANQSVQNATFTGLEYAYLYMYV